YRSWVRSPELVIRGPLGELRDEVIRIVSLDEDEDHFADGHHLAHDDESDLAVTDGSTTAAAAGGSDALPEFKAVVAGEPGAPAQVILNSMNLIEAPEMAVIATPVTAHIERVAAGGAGSHEGMFLRGYQVFGESAYVNPFLPARLADDELAIAEMLAKMGAHVLQGEPGPYSVAEAAQDKYLSLVMHKAARKGVPIRALKQPWSA
ncbi:MAG: hypothetical protein FWG25_10865, partial [Promicromonosporaceae bacterium]|nr:hypothetical protein [Promicromonosporaceae bacterium]